MNPKWVRAYVSEIDLGRVREGLEAYAEVDAFPDRRYPGRIGFISSVAEFTPKNVETEDLRTSLVYEVRVLVEDAADELRLGMPATVHIPPEETASPPPDAAPVSESTAGLAPPGD
jgi:HlyD family secretion protein